MKCRALRYFHLSLAVDSPPVLLVRVLALTPCSPARLGDRASNTLRDLQLNTPLAVCSQLDKSFSASGLPSSSAQEGDTGGATAFAEEKAGPDGATEPEGGGGGGDVVGPAATAAMGEEAKAAAAAPTAEEAKE